MHKAIGEQGINTDLDFIHMNTPTKIRSPKGESEAAKTLRDLKSQMNLLPSFDAQKKQRPLEPAIVKVIGKYSTVEKSLKALRSRKDEELTSPKSLTSTLRNDGVGLKFKKAQNSVFDTLVQTAER